jgi:hypothetical protein
MDDGWNKAGDALAADREKDDERTYFVNFLSTGKTCAWRWQEVRAARPLDAALDVAHRIARAGADEGSSIVVTTEGSTNVYVFPLVRVPPPPKPTPPPKWTVKV